MDCDFKIKIIVIGNSNVGKSCILTKYIDDEFNSKHNTTIGVDFKICHINHSHKNFKLFIWDTAGIEIFNTITKLFYINVDVIIICFDLTDIYSYNNVDFWLREIKKEKITNPIVILVGTKSDLIYSRAITKEEVLDKVDELNFHAYYETSAKLNIGIDDIFNDIVKFYCSSNNLDLKKKKLQINQIVKLSNIKLSCIKLSCIKSQNDKSQNDKLQNDKLQNNKLPYIKLSNDKTQNDKSSNNTSSNNTSSTNTSSNEKLLNNISSYNISSDNISSNEKNQLKIFKIFKYFICH